MRKILLIGLAFGLTGCASAMKKDPIKLEAECMKPGNENMPMCKYLSKLKLNHEKTKSTAHILNTRAHKKALIAWKGLKQWRSKALKLQDELVACAKGCRQ